MAGQISDAVKKCIAILKNTNSDTEKFAALFMVTKLVKGKDCNPVAKKAIFEAIGFDYIKRLLLTDDVPVDCPPSIYKSVALSILTVFCNEEELATHPEMLANVPVFLDIVQKADDEDLMSVGETYNCLKGIASFAPGQRALIEAGGVAKLSEIYSQGSFQSDEALNILAVLVSNLGMKSWNEDNPNTFHQLLNKIAVDFETDQDKRKFELCQVLNALIFNCPKKIAASADKATWPQSLYKGLTDILQSKIGAQQRNPALILASSTMELLGVEWALSDEEKPKQFFLLLIQLAAIEVRMQLDGKSLKAATSQRNLIMACYIILELSINYISTDQLDLDQKEKQTLYTGLKGAFTAIINLLIKVSNDKNKPSGEEKWFVYGTIRVLAAWLAQETSALRTQIYQLLPFILEVANETFYAHKARRVAEKAGIESDNANSVDILRILLPGLCHLAVEDPARAIILKNNEDKVLSELLQFHWTIVHYKRPPVPRSERLKVLNQPKQELAPEVLAEMQDSRTAMISTCNVLMNLTVLETKYVEESEVFNELLKFIFENLPELKDIPENLVLHGNLAVLGLLLLKQLSKKVKKNDFSICRYIQATIRFLWDAYIIDESNDPTALVVSMAYKEHWMEIMELWFLGMQTMSGVIAQIPWISEFAIESGWAEGIIQTLKKVKIGTLPPNVKSAYEDFLCHLVDANESVVDVLKKAEALRVCRNHRLMELGKKLFGD
ncbi:Neurochondrin domain containing protein [Asbolus verrucosus]|uniref:Neurochondrin domain containing protein n=1 Tax=Asbolus verrucosus TaxID=1661398 RepID=A0A482V1T2_ASBVE|nr:Neurochondrin domain containing protein [Asbolus verrucosus]